MHTMLALACLAFFAKKYVSTFSVHIKNTFDTMVSSSIYQDPRADISPPIMSRSRSEADRWKLVREVEQSFNAQSRQGGHYSDTTRPSWLLRRTRSSRIGEDDQSVLTANTCTTHSFKSKWQSSSASSKLGAVPKSQASFAVDSSFEATGLDVQSAAASRSHGLFYRQTSVRNKPLPVVQHPHEQQVGYCPTTVLGHSQSEVFPLPQALKQRKSSFFGRAGRHNSNHFPEYHPGVTRHSNIEIQVQPLPLLQSSASMGARLMVPDNLREDASIVSPPALVKRTSLLFTKLFPRRQKKLEQTPSSPQTLDSNGKKAESVGSYDYDEEVAMASSSSSSFDFRLPETLITNSPHRKKQHRSYADKSYIVGRDEHALLDRWSPSPVPPEPTSTPITKQTKSFTKAPKRPVRQDSVNKNIGQEEMEKQQQLLKSNLIQEKKDLLQQVRLVDSLLHEFSEHDDDDLDGESKEVDMVPHRMEDSTDDDSSNMSMLSGLMASWAADRDAAETPKPRLSVRFDRINIREYERIVGDNPSCTNGRTYFLSLLVVCIVINALSNLLFLSLFIQPRSVLAGTLSLLMITALTSMRHTKMLVEAKKTFICRQVGGRISLYKSGTVALKIFAALVETSHISSIVAKSQPLQARRASPTKPTFSAKPTASFKRIDPTYPIHSRLLHSHARL